MLRRHPRVAVALATLFLIVAWAVLVVVGTIDAWWHRPLAPPGDNAAFLSAEKQLIDSRNRGNIAFALIEDGVMSDAYFVSLKGAIGPETLFQVASLSKWITACAVMTLVDAGKIDLDAPVSRYLTRWQLPPSEFDNDGVTVRRLLSHTAGLTDGLGFAGFPPGVELPSLEENLSHPDASPGHSGEIRVGTPPGSGWQYSGGGYLVLQLLIEEVTGEPFEVYLRRALFQPLGMERSTFTVDASTPDVATFFDTNGAEAIHYRFRAKAAASLYTNVADMTRFVQAHMATLSGERIGRGVLNPETLRLMRRPEGRQFGADIWGLGVMLFAPVGDDFVFGHDGNNDPAINTAVRLNPKTGDAIVVLETGNKTLASTLAGEWVFWQTGHLDFIMLAMRATAMVKAIVAGAAVILLIGVFVGWRVGRRATASTAS